MNFLRDCSTYCYNRFMKVIEKRRKVCNSWYHQKWFRVILVLVGIDMFFLGFAFAANIDLFALIPKINIILHFIFGFMYMLVASFIIHYALDYKRFKKKSNFICHYCVCSMENDTKKD